MKVRVSRSVVGFLPFSFSVLPFIGYTSDSFGRAIYIGWFTFTVEFELWSLFDGENDG